MSEPGFVEALEEYQDHLARNGLDGSELVDRALPQARAAAKVIEAAEAVEAHIYVGGSRPQPTLTALKSALSDYRATSHGPGVTDG